MLYRSPVKKAVFFLLAAFAVLFSFGQVHTGVAAGKSAGQATVDTHAEHWSMLQDKSVYHRTEQLYQIPDVELIDMQGQTNSLKALIASGRPILLNFIFTTCPSICPVASATFAQFQKKLQSAADKPLLISISIDPEHDTPERLMAYAKKFGADSDWLFLTGRLEDIIRVEKAFDAYRGEKMNHEPLIFLHASGMDNWIRLEGFASGRELIIEYKKLLGNDHE